MKTTAIFSYKGGVGKTTTAINLAAELAARGRKVVLIDADGQRNTTELFGASSDGSTVYELLTGREPYAGNLLQKTDVSGLNVVASSAELATVELDALRGGDALHLRAIRDFCEGLQEDSDADDVLIDCPPSFAPQSVAALLAADEIIVPVTPDAWAVSGLRDLNVSIAGARKSNPALRIRGVLLTKFSASAVARDTEVALRRSGYPVFDTAIRQSFWSNRSSFDRKPLGVMARWTGIAQDYRDLCDEYLEEV